MRIFTRTKCEKEGSVETRPNDPITWEQFVKGCTDTQGNIISGSNTGLTKREYFAGMAMQGILAHGDWMEDRIVSDSVKYADALIAELNKPKTDEGNG